MREVIIGSHSQYKIREDGTVFSRMNGRYITEDWKELKASFAKCDYRGGGYLQVGLTLNKGQKSKSFRVHRLVAKFFVPGKSHGLVVNHIDGNRHNNHANNLEWVTPKQNMENASSRGSLDGRNKFGGKLTEEQVLTIVTLINSGKTNMEIAKDYNLDPSNISKLRHKKGSHWKSVWHLVKNPLRKKYGVKSDRNMKFRKRDSLGRYI